MEILMVSLTLPIFWTTRTILLDHLSWFCNTTVLQLWRSEWHSWRIFSYFKRI